MVKLLSVNEVHFYQWKLADFAIVFTAIWLLGFDCWLVTIGLDNGLSPVRRQANDDAHMG